MRVDHAKLLGALHAGLFEQPLWSGFLEQLRAVTGCLYVGMIFRAVGPNPLVELHAGEEPPEAMRRHFRDRSLLDPDAHNRMREGRVYAMEELIDPADPDYHRLYEAQPAPWNRTDSRTIRVSEPNGFDARLTCSGSRRLGWPAISALMAMLAPHLSMALRTFATLERERFRGEVASETLGRLDFGWLTLDARCRIGEASTHMEQVFKSSNVLKRGRYDRLVPASPAIDRELTELVSLFAREPDSRPRAINLSRDPSIDLLVRPIRDRSLSSPAPQVAIAYVSGDRWSQADRCEQLVDLFGLLPSEARLAWTMAQGTSIADAADELGLTVETARNYSKKIYAKTGSRGHADLVRNILTSVLALT